ncbi:MAG: PPOX class F420-dependent oxidoreductase [Alphaproteobacteria bacterium]
MDQGAFEAIVKQPLNAVLATSRRAGAAQLSPIWYLFEDGRFYISCGADSAKARNIRRDSRVSLCVDEGHPDGRSVTVYGDAEVIEEPSAWVENLYQRMTRHYHETEAAARHYEETKPDWGPSVLLAITPEKIVDHSDE